MNLGQMRTEVRYNLGETTADFWSDAELTSALNEAVRRFNQAEAWPWLITEVTNGSLAAGATSFVLTEGVSIGRHVNVLLTPTGATAPYDPKRVSAADGFRLRKYFGTTTGDPLYYYLVSMADSDTDQEYIATIRFLPTPARACTVSYQYFRGSVEMVADADEPDLPLDYHQAIVHDAAGQRWLKELNGASKAAEQFELRNAILEQARDEYMNEASDDFLVVGGEEPQLGPFDEDMYTRLRIPDILG